MLFDDCLTVSVRSLNIHLPVHIGIYIFFYLLSHWQLTRILIPKDLSPIFDACRNYHFDTFPRDKCYNQFHLALFQYNWQGLHNERLPLEVIGNDKTACIIHIWTGKVTYNHHTAIIHQQSLC